MDSTKPLLRVTDLTVSYPIRSTILQRKIGENHAVNEVSFDIPHGKTIGLVGESGSGKSTIARAIAGLNRIDSGRVEFDGKDITGLYKRDIHNIRQSMQMIFQDPYASLNPRLKVFNIIAEGWQIHRDVMPRNSWRDEVASLLERVGLSANVMDRYPHQFSGGQRQRLGIARALTLRPKLIICDEAVSALDVSVQAQVLNLLDDLQEEFQLTYLFIAHDLSVVRHISDEVIVLKQGNIVESGPVRKIFDAPSHDYTKSLLSAVPKVRPWRVETA